MQRGRGTGKGCQWDVRVDEAKLDGQLMAGSRTKRLGRQRDWLRKDCRILQKLKKALDA